MAGALLGTVVAAGCSSGAGAQGAPTMREVRAVLARHGSAVLAHSAQRFLDDVDTAKAARAFRARQTNEIENISGVPLRSFAYRALGADKNRTELGAATRRYGAPALIVQVQVSYRLQGIDTVPDRHDLWWTFVRRGAHVYLAGDDDLAQAGSTSWRGLWDFGPVVAARGASSLVLGHIPDALTLTALAHAVDKAVPAVSAVWPTGWSQRVAVLVPDSQQEFEALVGAGTGYQDVSAVALTGGTDPASGQVYGQRLVMDPAALGTLSGLGRQIVVRHELTHLATAAATAQTTPRWLVEGFADYVAQRGLGQPVRTAASELAAQVAKGKLPSRLPDDAAFAAGRSGRAQAYEQAWLACRLIAAKAGTAGLVRFYRQVGGALLPANYALAQALHGVLHESPAAFTAQWRHYLIAQLG